MTNEIFREALIELFLGKEYTYLIRNSDRLYRYRAKEEIVTVFIDGDFNRTEYPKLLEAINLLDKEVVLDGSS